MMPLVSRPYTTTITRAAGMSIGTSPPSSLQSANSADLEASQVLQSMQTVDIESMLNAWTAAQIGVDANFSEATYLEHYFSNEMCKSDPFTIDFSKAPRFEFKVPVEDSRSHLNPVRTHMIRPYNTILGELSVTRQQLSRRKRPADFDMQVDFNVFGEVMMVQDIETLKKRLKPCSGFPVQG